jgi:GTP cyclohydrolase IB
MECGTQGESMSLTGTIQKTSMPDVAAGTAHAGALDWVGMQRIDLPLTVVVQNERSVSVAAKLDAMVDLKNTGARGIHMSRLYLDAQTQLTRQPLTLLSLRHVLRDFLQSHQELSSNAMLRLRFDLLLERKALRSDYSGYKSYPVEILATQKDGHFVAELQVEALYSSTCPCSAALARQLSAQAFLQQFSEEQSLDRDAIAQWLQSEQGMPATPHAQRSQATVRVRLHDQELPFVALIDVIEEALQTPVQTAVKREDEQAFALLNGQNLMFCEDAARRLAQTLGQTYRDYHLQVQHFESLHAHDAVASASRGDW